MFRMEFQSRHVVEEDDESSKIQKNGSGDYMSRTVEGSSSPARIYDGQVGKHGKLERRASSASPRAPRTPPSMSRSLSSNEAVSFREWMNVDMIDFEAPTPKPEAQVGQCQYPVDGEVLKELVKPFAESVNVSTQPDRHLLDNGMIFTSLGYEPGRENMTQSTDVKGIESMCVSSQHPDTQPLRTNLIRSTSSGFSDSYSDTDAETSTVRLNAGEKQQTTDEEKGSPSRKSYHRAFNKLLHKKAHKPIVSDVKFSKHWDEPLLAVHEQAKLERKAQKEANKEAKRAADEAKGEAERTQSELRNLASPVPESALGAYKDSDVLAMATKGIHKLFHLHGTHHVKEPKEPVGFRDAREAKVVMPKTQGIFAEFMSPASTDVIRTAVRPTSRNDLKFATVESNQRDVQPWTMEEYMAKNARLSEWKHRKDDEEFGGVEGNNLLNLNNFAFDSDTNTDSDSD